MKKNHTEPKSYIMSKEVHDRIVATIGANPPEQGGFLGSKDGKCISHYFYDSTANTTNITYSPDIEAANYSFQRWNADGVELIFNIHSHPYGCTKPSAGDIEYAQHIMKHLNSDRFGVIIVTHDAYGSGIHLHPYFIYADGTVEPIQLIFEEKYNPYYLGSDFDFRKRISKERFKRIEDFYPMEALARKAIVGIGVGGAITYYEDQARSGIEYFVVIDPDIVSATNIATSSFYITDIGRSKVDVIKERIHNINPNAKVVAVQLALDDNFTDLMFEEILGQELLSRPQDILICGCTDSFHAQARSANLAMKYGTCYLAAQLYAGGEAAEIYFSYPGVTNNSCPRCALSSRYDAYKNGFVNNVTSEAAPIFATDRLNALKGQISMMLLLYHEDDNCRYSSMLDQTADRNFVQINMSPTASEHLGLNIFKDTMNPEFAFFDETAWIPQVPNNEENGFKTCPLCGGSGDLLSLKGKIEDSRRIL